MQKRKNARRKMFVSDRDDDDDDDDDCTMRIRRRYTANYKITSNCHKRTWAMVFGEADTGRLSGKLEKKKRNNGMTIGASVKSRRRTRMCDGVQCFFSDSG